jgi:hypothetical protein
MQVAIAEPPVSNAVGYSAVSGFIFHESPVLLYAKSPPLASIPATTYELRRFGQAFA